jgi:hypothetical protein
MTRLVHKPAIQLMGLLVIALLFASSSSATTAILLSDEQLITSSRVILLGEIKSAKAQWNLNHENIETYVKVKVSTVLKGELQHDEIVFRQLGGTVGDASTVIFGAPSYKAGDRVLLFLDTARDGTLRIAHLFQGKYDVVEDTASGQQRARRHFDVDAVNILGPKDGPNITNEASLNKLTKKIRKVLRTNAAEVSEYDAQRADTPIVETPVEYIDDPASDPQGGDLSAQYTFLGNFRWFQPDTGQPVQYRLNQTSAPIAGGGVTEINQALAAWTNVQTTALVLQNAGSTTSAGFLQDGVSALSFNDPLDQMSDPVGCSGVLAIGGVTSAGGGTRVIGGITFSHIFEGDVVFNRNFSCFLGISANLAEVATHEIGHSIGFDHSADPNATMYATAHGGGRGATLGTDDIAAVSFLYPGSKVGTAPPPAYSGVLDIANCSVIAGWAWDANQSSSPINVDIFDGSTLIATVAANQFRQDLANAGIGNGIHAFSFATPASLKNGQTHSIAVKISGTSVALSGSPKSLNCSGTTPVYGGFHDLADCQNIAGWAWDQNNPNTPINVDIYDGTTLIATVAANAFRQDLANAGIGNGVHAFSFATPASLKNGQSHTIRVKFAGTSTDLSATGKTINCGATSPQYQGFHDAANCQTISGWAWDANQPNTVVNVAIFDGSTLIATVPANLFRQDLLNAGIGNGVHGFSFTTPTSLKNGQPHSLLVRISATQTNLQLSPKTLTCP